MNKRKYLIETGRQNEFTVAELLSLYPDIELLEQDTEHLLCKTSAILNQKSINKMGSVIKIYSIIESISDLNNFDDILESIEPTVGTFALYLAPKQKFSNDQYKVFLKKLKKHYQAHKSALTGKIRYLNHGSQNVKTAYLLSEGFLKDKISEWGIIELNSQYHLVKTVAIQDINAYSKRDYEKPARDMRRGMFPPKLAQMLINLSTPQYSPEPTTIFDPFCGEGIIGMEASLMGLPNINSDVDPKAVADTKKNIDWLKQNFSTKDVSSQVFVLNAINLANSSIPKKTIVNIVTEGYLGPILSKPINNYQSHPAIKQIETLYRDFLKSAKKALTAKSKVVFCLPVFRSSEHKLVFCKNVVENLEQLGYIKQAFWPKELQSKLKLQNSGRETLVYMRPNQIVGREIIVAQVSSAPNIPR